MKKGSLALMTMLLLLAAPSLVLAQTAAETVVPEAPPESQPEGNYTQMQVLGMQVWIDQETGQMRPPTAEEAAVLSAQMQELFAASPRGVEVRRAQRADGGKGVQGVAREQQLANGTVMVELGLEHLDFSQAHVEPDGSLSYQCGDASHQLQAAAAASQIAQPEEK